jgi:hypothetical protein
MPKAHQSYSFIMRDPILEAYLAYVIKIPIARPSASGPFDFFVPPLRGNNFLRSEIRRADVAPETLDRIRRGHFRLLRDPRVLRQGDLPAGPSHPGAHRHARWHDAFHRAADQGRAEHLAIPGRPGGIVGTFHHLYFSGTPTAVLALGATFSALEVVPLILIGFEACHNLNLAKAAGWVRAYRWPIYCFIAVAFWNLVGAGIFGFLINPPLALYYMQGLNTTPVHGHTALFGVYGMLGIGLMLFVMKGLAARQVWRNGLIRFSFWAINGGLALMVLLSVLPVGILQAWASVQHGLWYARSADFMQTPLMDTLRWLRLIGDTVFTAGAVALGLFVVGLKTGWSFSRPLPN